MISSSAPVTTERLAEVAFLGRQPIFDRQKRTHAYQLLHRGNERNRSEFTDDDQATRELIEHTLFQWGLDKVLGSRPGFLHVTASFLASGLYRALPPNQIVLDLLEDVDLDASTRELAAEAQRHGYRLALDDVVGAANPPSPDLIEMADVIKVDISAVRGDDLANTVRTLRALAPRAMLLAEKVEELLEFRTCVAHGFDYFLGYFFAKPEVLSKGKRSLNSTAAIALLVEVQRPDLSMQRLEQLVTGDPTLAFRLLSVVNSGLIGLATRVESVSHALVLLGIDRVRQLATLVTMASHATASAELVTLGATRAFMARQLVRDAELGSSAYTVGLLSVLDSIFRIPMAELVEEMPLAPVVVDALRDGAGELGSLLQAIQAYERGDLPTLERLRPGALTSFIRTFTEAAAWADQLRAQLGGG